MNKKHKIRALNLMRSSSPSSSRDADKLPHTQMNESVLTATTHESRPLRLRLRLRSWSELNTTQIQMCALNGATRREGGSRERRRARRLTAALTLLVLQTCSNRDQDTFSIDVPLGARSANYISPRAHGAGASERARVASNNVFAKKRASAEIIFAKHVVLEIFLGDGDDTCA